MICISGYLRLFALAAIISVSSSINISQAQEDAPTDRDAARFEELHKAWLETDNLQLERPIPEPAAEPAPPRRRQSIGFFRWLADLLNSLAPLFRLIFYVGLAFGAGTILYFILTEFTDVRLGRSHKQSSGPEDDVLTTARPDEKAARSLLEDADALAQEGRFSEAVHLLLFRSIRDIRSRRDKHVPDALTAREIGELEDLPYRPRLALKPIVTLVERSFFGGRDLVIEDWKRARESYEAFAFGETWT